MPLTGESNLFGARLAAENARQRQRDEEELLARAEILEQAVSQRLADESTYLSLARVHRALGRYDHALRVLRQGAAAFPRSADLLHVFRRMLWSCGEDDAALELLSAAGANCPGDYSFRLHYELYLPMMYRSAAEIGEWRDRFRAGLRRIEALAPCNREEALLWAAAFARYAPFLLAYQGIDDLDLIKRYGALLQTVMATAWPQLNLSGRKTRVEPRERPLVGYVSNWFRDHTVGDYFFGWVQKRDRSLYDVHCYYTSQIEDSKTRQYRECSQGFYQSTDFEALCSAISSDGPDILIFTDIGMHPLTSQIAALRLAPIQCAAYGHPVSTGLPTIDYFLSGEALETAESDSQYTEKLVRLPGLGVSYAKPVIPRALLPKTRQDFGLPTDAVIYLCSQSFYKLMPQYDVVFPKIAQAVPSARFVFLAPNELRGSWFRSRIAAAFQQEGLRGDEFCILLPEQSKFDYWNLHLCSDLFLDTPGWSGGKSSLDALSCELPIVTIEGNCMRRRQTSAMLRLLNLDSLIADNLQRYIDIAIELGKDKGLRQAVQVSITANAHRLFGTQDAVRVLEAWVLAAEKGPVKT